MPLLNVTFKSHILEMDCGVNVILPQSSPEKTITKPYKTLYLLHGLSDDHTAWTRWTSIERYALDYDIAVVMPNVNRSFYSDSKYGKYFTFVSEELISIMEEMFPLSNKREDRYAAGLSMGGYGAMKLGLSCPEKFSVAASLSGALDIIGRLSAEAWLQNEFSYLLKSSEEDRQKIDLFYLAEKLNASNQPKPRLYIWCGTEDFLYQDNVKFRNFIKKMSFDYTYEESAGDHQWRYWDLKIQTVLKFIFN
ncbi:MAG: esterase family protein [Oscillospiraceae bacterium]|nr:esterase family protein [Oscillospiraceae bacterium]